MDAGLEVLAAWMPADALVSRLEDMLRVEGATCDDVDERIAEQLGVPLHAWMGYLQVRSAADRYQWTAAGDALRRREKQIGSPHRNRATEPGR